MGEIQINKSFSDETVARVRELAQNIRFSQFFGRWAYKPLSEFGLPLTCHRVHYRKAGMLVYVTDDGLPVAIVPTVKNKRGGFEVAPPGDRMFSVDVFGIVYLRDPCGNAKWQDAAFETLIAFMGNSAYDAVAMLGAKSGACCICGALLTDPESQSRGIGPECIKKIGVKKMYAQKLAMGKKSVALPI